MSQEYFCVVIFKWFCDLFSAFSLVDHLLRDLQSTTYAYKQLAERESKLSDHVAQAQAQLFPLRNENARLAKENYELHRESIRQNEAIQNSIEDHGRDSRELHDEIQGLKFKCEEQQRLIRTKDYALAELREVKKIVLSSV